MNKPTARASGQIQVKQLSLCIALALHGWAMAQAADDTRVQLPDVKVRASADRETTEGTNSYVATQAKTATPLSLSPRDTPQSVSVVTRQRIEDQGLLNITDVLNNVTGVFVHQYETSRAQFTARGFDINTLMMDGVPTSWVQPWSSGEIATSTAIFDRVEVVRGATGLTTGAGDPSAAVNLARKRANAKAFTGAAELGVGSWDLRRGLVDLSAPLNEAKTLRARVVGEYKDRDSWVDGLSNKNKTLFAAFEADLTPNTLLTAGISNQDNEAHGSMWGGLPVWYADGSRADWDVSKTTSADWVQWNSTYQNYYASLEHRFAGGWSVKASYSHGDRKADSDLLYLSGAPDRATGLGLGAFAGSYRVHTVQEDLGLQASGPFQLLGRTHEASVGYTNSTQNFRSNNRIGSGYSFVAPDFNNWDRSFTEPAWTAEAFYGDSVIRQEGFYGAARLSLADPLKLILGARLSNYRRTNGEFNGTTNRTDYSTTETSDKVTPYAGLVYDINETYSAYASYTDIFQPQIERGLGGSTLDPILGKATELGVKGEFFNGRLNASAAVFEVKQDNLAQSTGQYFPGSTELIYRATDGAASRGFEFEVSGELAKGWNLSAGYSQFRATDATGEDVNSIYPRKTLRLFTSYRLGGALAGLTLGGGVNWQSSTYTLDPANNNQKIEQEAYALVNLMARYEFTNQWSAQLNIGNVFDKKTFAMFAAYNQMTYGEPRNTTLTVRYKF